MIQVNIHEAKTQFSRYIAMVERGETVQVCRNNELVAEIRLPKGKKAKKRRRYIGGYEYITIHPDHFNGVMDAEIQADFDKSIDQDFNELLD